MNISSLWHWDILNRWSDACWLNYLIDHTVKGILWSLAGNMMFKVSSQFIRQTYKSCPSKSSGCSGFASFRFKCTFSQWQSADRLSRWMKRRKHEAEANVSFLHPDGGFQWKPFYTAWAFSSTSQHLNTVSHSVPSLPDGPWPSQPYLHLLTGPTSYYCGRLLAGNTHLYSLCAFIFCWLLSTEMMVWRSHRAASPLVFM